jgi:hypothetical protein
VKFRDAEPSCSGPRGSGRAKRSAVLSCELQRLGAIRESAVSVAALMSVTHLDLYFQEPEE